MFWVIAATLLVFVVANSPLMYSAIYLHKGNVFKLYAYGPQQIFFLTFPFLIAAYCSFLSFKQSLEVAKQYTSNDPLLISLASNWQALILGGVVLVSIVCIGDYFGSAKIFPTMKPVYANRAVEASDALRKEIESHSSEDERMKSRQLLINKSEGVLEKTAEGRCLPENEMISLGDSSYIRLVMTSSVQKKCNILDDTIHSLTVLQLFVVLISAFFLVAAIMFSWLIVKSNPNAPIGPALSVIKYGVIAFSIYPFCYRYFVAEMELISAFTSTTRGDLLSTALIILVSIIVISIDAVGKDFMAMLMRGFPLMLVSGSSALVTATGALSLRPLIGIDSNIGTRMILFVILFIVAFFIVVSSWPRNLTSPQENKVDNQDR